MEKQAGKEKRQEEAMKVFEQALDAFYNRDLNVAAEMLIPLVKQFEDLQDYTMVAKTYNLMGVIYSIIGSDGMEMDCYLNGLKCAKENGAFYVMLLCLNNVGNLYQKLHEYRRAMSFFEECMEHCSYLDIGHNPAEKNFKHVVLENMALCYLKLNSLEDAEHCLEKLAEQSGVECMESFEYMLVQFLIDLKKGNTQKVREGLPKLENLLMTIQDPVSLMESLEDYIFILKELEEPEYWKRILEHAYVKVQEYKGCRMKVQVLEYCMECAKTLHNEEVYDKLCSLYVTASLEKKEETRLEWLQIADTKLTLFDRENEWIQVQKERLALQQAAETDMLTGLGTRYRLQKYGTELLEKAKEERLPLIVGILDVDCFKQFNDTYGHVAGDKCLVQVAEMLNKSLEKISEQGGIGYGFRYGGDELLVMIAGLSVEQLKSVASEFSTDVDNLEIENKNSTVRNTLSISQGYYCQVPRDTDTLENFLKRADVQLYKVKDNSRDDFLITVGS